MSWFFRKRQATEGLSGPAYRPSPDVRASRHSGGLVLLDTRKGTVLAANAVGARIWEELAAGGSLDGISAAIARDFGVAESVARADAESFVRELRAEGVLLGAGATA